MPRLNQKIDDEVLDTLQPYLEHVTGPLVRTPPLAITDFKGAMYDVWVEVKGRVGPIQDKFRRDGLVLAWKKVVWLREQGPRWILVAWAFDDEVRYLCDLRRALPNDAEPLLKIMGREDRIGTPREGVNDLEPVWLVPFDLTESLVTAPEWDSPNRRRARG
jgi:hypothetical protein